MINFYDVNIRHVKTIGKIYETCLKHLGQKQIFTLDVTIIEDVEMRELNYKTRKKDEVTDVLSFPNLQIKKLPVTRMMFKNDIEPEDNKVILGEIIISEAHERQTPQLFLHGLLHLLGFDHETDEQYNSFKTTEEGVLKRLKISNLHS
jgi:probable rRNA maturation factor